MVPFSSHRLAGIQTRGNSLAQQLLPAACPQGLSWDSAYLRGGSTDVVHSHSGWLGHKLCYAAPALPALQQLSLEADAVALCPSYSRALPALTHLSLTGMAVQLPAGCLPRTLRMLRVSLQGEHAALSRGLVAQLPAAAEGSPGIQCFELAWNTRWVVPLAGLSALRALTALRLRSVRIEALPEDLARLSGLQELSLPDTALLGGGLEPLAGLPNLTRLELLGVWGGADFAGAWTLPQLQVGKVASFRFYFHGLYEGVVGVVAVYLLSHATKGALKAGWWALGRQLLPHLCTHPDPLTLQSACLAPSP